MKLAVLARMLDLKPAGLEALAVLEDLERLASRKLPRVVSDFVAGGADSETTLRRNLSAFGQIDLEPRYLRDVSDRSITTDVLGQSVQVPVMLSPAGLAGLVHRDGELAAAWCALSSVCKFIYV